MTITQEKLPRFFTNKHLQLQQFAQNDMKGQLIIISKRV